jgi:serine/threonine-protein kinase HipA
MMQELQAWTNGSLMGRVLRDAKRNTMTFVYDDSWWDEFQSFPLSLSMPLSATEHGNSQITPFLWGLLPDNDAVLRRWGDRYKVSPSNVFRILEHVGEDCAGAVQFVTPERVDSWIAAAGQSEVEWLSKDDIAERLRLLLRDHSASRAGADRGHFSLAGAQPKTAFHYDLTLNRWGVPSGQIPTTHIFKPPTGDFDGYAENEHFCLALARSLGMPTASAELMNFDGVPVVVSARYDRIRHQERVVRIHQEDTCQALAKLPERKYQNEGGPSAVAIMGLIRQHSAARAEDESRFTDALIFNWLIMGTAAHAKN